MGLFLFILALGLFALGAAGVLIVTTWRRTEQHRVALLAAYERIGQLETTLSAVTFGLAPEELAKLASTQVVLLPTERTLALPREEEPLLIDAAGVAHVGAPIAAEAISAPVPSPIASPEPATAAEPVAARVAEEPAAAVADQRLQLPRTDLVATICGLIALAAMAASRIGVLAPLGGAAIAAQAGLVCVGLAIWRGRAEPSPLLATFGLAIMTGAILLARYVSPDVPPWAAQALLSVLALGALYLARAHGALLAGVALVAGLSAPLLAPLDEINTWPRHVGLFALAAYAAIAAGRAAPRATAWLAFIGAMGWIAASAVANSTMIEAAATSGACALMGLLAIAYAWPRADGALWETVRRVWPGEAVFAGYALFATGIAVLLLVGIVLPYPAPAPATAVLIVLAGFAALAAAYRPTLTALPLATAGAAAVALALWPAGGAPHEALIAAGALAAVCLLGGIVMTMRGSVEGAALAALGPLTALVAAQARLLSVAPFWAWAAGAVVLAALTALAFLQWRRSAASPVFLAAALLGTVTAIGFLIPMPWPPLAVALALPIAAWADRRFNQPGLRIAIALLAWFLVLHVGATALGPAQPAVRGVLALSAAVAAYASARSLASGRRDWLSAQAVFVAALAIAATAATLEAYRALVPSGPLYFLNQAGAYVAAWSAAVLLVAWNFGPKPRRLIAWSETALALTVGVGALAAGLVTVNPWWGVTPSFAPGAPMINSLGLGYLVPALLFGAYSWLRERQGLKLRANIALYAALVLAFVYLTLELRRAFQGPAMAGGAIYPSEGWAYSFGWFGFAAAVLLLSIERGKPWLRYVAIGIVMAALVKAAIFDLAAFGGFAQIAVLALIAAAVAGLTFAYRRYVLPGASDASKTAAKPSQPN